VWPGLRRGLPSSRVAPETTALMQTMVEDGEVDHLVPERVWQEIAKGLMEAPPLPHV